MASMMVPCEGFSPVWEWAGPGALGVLRELWGRRARFVRESVGAPDWAEYVDRAGAAWSREGLLTRLVFDAIDLYGESHVDATIKQLGNDGMVKMLDGWIDARVFVGELVRLVGEGEA
nr:MAG TPA: Selenoprotein, putative [Caudoviricetes sp.]